ncbi:hypothetical protein [Mariniflexile sp.]|uniref:hypothetical protein n=1 Tax=Mariniflexile sp. TaxID=1979402 RepID=UPI00356B1DF4
MANKVENYSIETETDLSVVREKMDKLFSNANHIFKGKLVGSFNNDIFQGSTNYNTNIIVKGKIIKNNNITVVKMTISDNSPNYATVSNALLIIFLGVSLIIIAANKSTDFLTYLIPIIIFGLAFLTLKIQRRISRFFKPKLNESAKLIAKEINGTIKNIG